MIVFCTGEATTDATFFYSGAWLHVYIELLAELILQIRTYADLNNDNNIKVRLHSNWKPPKLPLTLTD